MEEETPPPEELSLLSVAFPPVDEPVVASVVDPVVGSDGSDGSVVGGSVVDVSGVPPVELSSPLVVAEGTSSAQPVVKMAARESRTHGRSIFRA